MTRFNLTVAGIFALIAMPYVLWSALVTPPFQILDEPPHYRYARGLSTGALIPEPIENGVGAMVPGDALQIEETVKSIAFHPDQKYSEDRRAAFFKVPPSTESVFAMYWGAAFYPPFPYAVPAVGLWMAGKMGLTPGQSFIMGRITNALFYVLGGAAILLLLPAGQGPVMAMLLLPMSTFQAGSYSADVFAIVTVGIATALLARAAFRPQRSHPWSLIVVAVLMALAAMSKLPFTAFAIAILLIGGRHYSWRLAAMCAATVVILPVVWVLGFTHLDESYPIPGVSALAQLSYLLGNPGVWWQLAVNTISDLRVFKFYQVVGMIGWDSWLPAWVYGLIAYFLISTFCFNFVQHAGSKRIAAVDRLVFLTTILLAVAITYGLLYLTYNQVGAITIRGVQGRYILPYVPALAIAATSVFPDRGGGAAAVAMATLGAMIWLPIMGWAVVNRFY